MATSAASIAVVPGGGENVNCVLFALERIGVRPVLTLDPKTVAAAERVILMGVGAAAPGMAKLSDHGLIDCLRGLQQPVLGICVGMQLLFERSAEGDVPCLGMLPGPHRGAAQWRRSDGAAYGLEPARAAQVRPAVAGGHQERRLGLLRQQLLRAAVSDASIARTRLRRADIGRRPARQRLWLSVPSGEVAAQLEGTSSQTF